MVNIPDPSVCGEVSGGEVELSELSGSKNVNTTTKMPTTMATSNAATTAVTQRHIMHFNWWRENKIECHQWQGGSKREENSSAITQQLHMQYQKGHLNTENHQYMQHTNTHTNKHTHKLAMGSFSVIRLSKPPYSGNLGWVKTFENCWKSDFRD